MTFTHCWPICPAQGPQEAEATPETAQRDRSARFISPALGERTRASRAWEGEKEN